MARPPKVGPVEATLLAVPVPSAALHGEGAGLVAIPTRNVDDGEGRQEAPRAKTLLTPAKVELLGAVPAPLAASKAVDRLTRPVPAAKALALLDAITPTTEVLPA